MITTSAKREEERPRRLREQTRGHDRPEGVDMPESTVSVYLYRDLDNLLIYVGITSRGTTRQNEHDAQKPWWPFVASQTIEHYPTREAAHAREIELIQRHHPPFNIQHNLGHAEVLAMYLENVANPAEIEPFARVYRSGMYLGLEKLTQIGRRALYRTAADDTSLARALIFERDRHVLHDVGGATLRSVDVVGAFAVITLTSHHDLPGRVEAKLKARNFKGRGIACITSIRVMS